METMISSRFFPPRYKGREKGEARANAAAVTYKYSFLSGSHNEFRKLSGTINRYHISSNDVSGALLAAPKRCFRDCLGNVRKLGQNPGLPQGGNDPDREAWGRHQGTFPQGPSQGDPAQEECGQSSLDFPQSASREQGRGRNDLNHLYNARKGVHGSLPDQTLRVPLSGIRSKTV